MSRSLIVLPDDSAKPIRGVYNGLNRNTMA